MIKRYCLVSTADERTWPEDKPILFLGEWCKRFSRKNSWIDLDSETLRYHWNDRKKLIEDYNFLKELHEVLLNELSTQLNRIHKKNYSTRYWRILIGPWLGYFTQALFDRWSTLNLSLEEFDIDRCYILSNSSSVVASDMKDFDSLFIDDKWNEVIFGQLIQNLSESKMNINFVDDQLCDSSLTNKRALYSKLKDKLKILLSKLSSFLTRKEDYFFISSYIPLFTQFKLQLQLNQFPSLWFSPKIDYPEVDLNKRNWVMESLNSKDKFIKIVCQLIPKHIPIAYLEGYNLLSQNIENIKWPENPKAIFTSNAYLGDEVFKAWAAKKTENGIPFIIGQHGGHFGVTQFAFFEEHQIKVSDNFLSWGWSSQNNSKIKPFANIKLLNNKLKYNPNGDALMIGLTIPRYSYHLYAAPISSQLLSYFSDQFNFIRALPHLMQQKILVRLAKNDNGWDQKLRWENEFSDINIDSGDKSIRKLLKNSRICISTYNATSYLETLSWNMPTIIFWDEKYWDLNQDAVPYFKLLIDAGIFHKTPQSAAKKITEIWDDIDSWWYSEQVQNARFKFCERFSRVSDNSLNEFRSLLNKV
jgi:putative transferase (TIGR04331 family)